MRIVFMGTPDFAVPSLQALLRSSYQVVGVVTQPDRPKGRGKAMTPSPIKTLAQTQGLPILQPEKMKDPGFFKSLQQWEPDLIAVTAFGRILPSTILQLPPKGCVNVHASLLPRYRGAAPIQWAVINGETETGITTMLMDEGMDTGPMLEQQVVPIYPDETAGELAIRLAEVGGTLLVHTLQGLDRGGLLPQSQPTENASLAPQLKKEEGNIDWTLGADHIVHRIRGLSPWPGTYSFLDGERIMIWKACALPRPDDQGADTWLPGTILALEHDTCLVSTGKGVLAISELQPENKKRMGAKQFLAGRRDITGKIFRPCTPGTTTS